ncbi:unnamed protein product [Withania somnifera]
MKLADCVLGFGRKTTGGKSGKIYVVKDNSDNDLVNPKSATLDLFSKNMVIRLSEELIMTMHIAHGGGLMLQFIHNVIINSLHIHDTKAGGGGLIRDSIGHYGYDQKVMVDHVSMSNCQDGLIDAVEGSTAITISNCHFTKNNDVMLFGASDNSSKDSIMQITLRMSRVRWGFIHAINNDYTHWLMYAIGGSMYPTILSQGNRFIAPPNRNAKEVTKMNYAPESVSKPGSLANSLTRFSGSLKCIEGLPC